MFLYWALFYTLLFMSIIDLSNRAYIIRFALLAYGYIALLFIIGFKYASIDYFGYQEIYYKTSFNDFSYPFYKSSMGTTGMEFLWATFSSFFRYISVPFEGWVFFVALVSF